MNGEPLRLPRHHARQGHQRVGQLDGDRVRIDFRDLGQEVGYRLAEITYRRPAVEGGDDIGGLHFFAVMEHDPLAKSNRVRQEVFADFMALGKHGDGLVRAVEREQRLVHLPADHGDRALVGEVHV
jgi:hypothetical protein